jgi:hypothetical protein
VMEMARVCPTITQSYEQTKESSEGTNCTGKSPWHLRGLRGIRVACVACNLRAFACTEFWYKSKFKIIGNITRSFCAVIRV